MGIINIISDRKNITLNSDVILYIIISINEQIKKIAQSYTATFINASKSLLAFAHWNIYRYFSS